MNAEVAHPNWAPYAANKKGLKMLTRATAIAVGYHGIGVNAI